SALISGSTAASTVPPDCAIAFTSVNTASTVQGCGARRRSVEVGAMDSEDTRSPRLVVIAQAHADGARLDRVPLGVVDGAGVLVGRVVHLRRRLPALVGHVL